MKKIPPLMPTSPRLTALATALSLLWAPGGPRAQEKGLPEAGLVGFAGTERAAEREVRAHLHAELAGSKRLAMLPDEAVAKFVEEFLNRESKQAGRDLDQALQNYLSGKKLYESLSVDEAIGALSESVRQYRESIGALRDNQYLLLSHLYLGMALVIRGRVSEGKEYIRQMVALDPMRQQRALSRREYPPKIVNLHSEIAREVVAGPSGNVTFKTVPAGARVYFDGVGQNPTPLVVEKVPVGEHFVLLELKGYLPVARRVTVAPGENRVEVALKEWKPFAPYAFDRRKDVDTNEMLARVSGELLCPLLFLGNLAERGEEGVALSAQVFDARSREFSRIVRVEAPRGKLKKASEDLARQILENVTTGGLVVAQIGPEKSLPAAGEAPSPLGPLPQRKSSGAPPIFRKWWFWTAVGAVVLGTGGYFLVANVRRDAGYNILVIDNPAR